MVEKEGRSFGLLNSLYQMLNKYQDKYFGTQWFPETVIFERHAKKYLHTINWNSNSPDKPGLLLQGKPDKLGDKLGRSPIPRDDQLLAHREHTQE